MRPLWVSSFPILDVCRHGQRLSTISDNGASGLVALRQTTVPRCHCKTGPEVPGMMLNSSVRHCYCFGYPDSRLLMILDLGTMEIVVLHARRSIGELEWVDRANPLECRSYLDHRQSLRHEVYVRLCEGSLRLV